MYAFVNARIFDGRSEALGAGPVVVEGDRIRQVGGTPPEGATLLDCGGRVLMPGLIDAHIHAYALDVNVQRILAAPPTLYAHHASLMLGRMLDRGFTSARDTGGADYGLWLALQRGLVTGPRLFYCEKALSQTGGHVDFRHHHHHEPQSLLCCGCGHVSALGMVVDGVDQVRRAVRENLRRGSSFIKFTGSGGVSSVSDPLHGIQFSDDEVEAIVDEVERHGVYCTAHIHPDTALKRSIRLGVHCIEHGTLIEADTARMAADRGTFIVPTLAIIAGLSEEGEALGYPPESLAKLAMIKDEAIERLRHMKEAGVKVGFGTDLLGKLERHQCREFALRQPVFSNVEILRQATSMNGEILGLPGELGVVAEGALADLILVDGNPLEELSLLAEDGRRLPLIMAGGRLHKNLL